MGSFLLFTDGSVSTKLKLGYGSYLLIPDGVLYHLTDELIRAEIRLKRFDSTTSTKLEIETVLWALRETEKSIKTEDKDSAITVYSDSQNIIELPNRRIKLEGSNYKTLRGDKNLKNADLYEEFYRMTDRLNCNFIKVSGHLKSKEKDQIDKIFTHVDRSSRKALRKYIETNKA